LEALKIQVVDEVSSKVQMLNEKIMDNMLKQTADLMAKN
jgi:hypothetical protein